jgi:hypothetical protein
VTCLVGAVAVTCWRLFSTPRLSTVRIRTLPNSTVPSHPPQRLWMLGHLDDSIPGLRPPPAGLMVCLAMEEQCRIVLQAQRTWNRQSGSHQRAISRSWLQLEQGTNGAHMSKPPNDMIPFQRRSVCPPPVSSRSNRTVLGAAYASRRGSTSPIAGFI